MTARARFGPVIRPPLERPLWPLRNPLPDFALVHVSNAIVAFLFAASAPVAIILSVGTRAGLSEAELSSWMFASFLINGIVTLVFTFLYRQPLVFFWTIPGVVLVGPALTHLSLREVMGASFITGVLMLLLGLSGLVRRAMQAIPMPIVMGMVAGVFLRFAIELVQAFRDRCLDRFEHDHCLRRAHRCAAACENPASADRCADRGRNRRMVARAASIRRPAHCFRWRSPICMCRNSRGRQWSNWSSRSRSRCWWCRTRKGSRC